MISLMSKDYPADYKFKMWPGKPADYRPDGQGNMTNAWYEENVYERLDTIKGLANRVPGIAGAVLGGGADAFSNLVYRWSHPARRNPVSAPAEMSPSSSEQKAGKGCGKVVAEIVLAGSVTACALCGGGLLYVGYELGKLAGK